MADILLTRLASSSLALLVMTLLAACAICVFRIRSARLRALIWVLILAKPVFTLLFGAAVIFPLRLPDFAGERLDAGPVTAVAVSEPALYYSEPVADGNASLPAGEAGSVSPAPAAPFPEFSLLHGLVILWLSGVCIMLLRTLNGHGNLRGVIRRSVAPRTPRLLRIFSDILSELKIKTPVSFRVSSEIATPVFAGLFHPVILIPGRLDSEEYACDARWVLRHELTHFILRDPVAQLIRQAALALFYFHPCAWYVSAKWEEAAEFACDRAVIKSAGDAEYYSRALSRIVEALQSEKAMPFTTGLFSAKTRIGRRIAALLSMEPAGPSRLSRIQILILCLFFMSAMIAGFTVTSDRTSASEARASHGIRTASPYRESARTGVGADCATSVSASGCFVSGNAAEIRNPIPNNPEFFILLSRNLSLTSAQEQRKLYQESFENYPVVIRADDNTGFNLLMGPFKSEKEVWICCAGLKSEQLPYMDIISADETTRYEKVMGPFEIGTGGVGFSRDYSVAIGIFKDAHAAEQLMNVLQLDGYICRLARSGSLYSVNIGHFSSMDDAQVLVAQLVNSGYYPVHAGSGEMAMPGE